LSHSRSPAPIAIQLKPISLAEVGFLLWAAERGQSAPPQPHRLTEGTATTDTSEVADATQAGP